jgi:hypothetical protein
MSRLTNKKLVNIEYGYVKTITKDEYRKQIAEAPSYKQLYDKLGQLEDLEEELGCPLEFVIEQLRKGFFLTYIDGRWLFCKLIPNDENEQLFEMKAFKTKEFYDYVCLAKETLDENGKVKFKDSACMTFPKSKEGYNEA